MCFYVIMCVSLGYKVLIGLKMIYLGILLCFMKFGGQTSNNISDI